MLEVGDKRIQKVFVSKKQKFFNKSHVKPQMFRFKDILKSQLHTKKSVQKRVYSVNRSIF